MPGAKAAFEKVGEFFHHVVDAIVDVVKAAKDAFVGAFKDLYQTVLALAEAIKTGDFKEMAKKLLELAAEIAMIANPEALAVSIGAQAAMAAVKQVIQLAAEVCGFKNQPWMKDVMGMISTGSNFTSFGKAAEAMGTELTAMAMGEKGPLQTEYEHLAKKDTSDDKDAAGDTEDQKTTEQTV